MPLRPRVNPNSDQLGRIYNGTFQRAGGGCTCEDCGKLYYDHSYFAEPYEFLTLLCNGSIVKL
jgi:hypothetical protein